MEKEEEAIYDFISNEEVRRLNLEYKYEWYASYQEWIGNFTYEFTYFSKKYCIVLHKFILAEFYLLFITIIIFCFAIYMHKHCKKYNWHYPVIIVPISWLSIYALIFVFFLLINNCYKFGHFYSFQMLIQNAPLFYFFKIFTVFSVISTLLISINSLKKDKINSFEYVILILFSVLGMLSLISSNDLISFYLSIELQSLCFYILAALTRTSIYATEAGLKYFILGAFSSGILLFGISLIYGITGTTNLTNLSTLYSLDCADYVGNSSYYFSNFNVFDYIDTKGYLLNNYQNYYHYSLIVGILFIIIGLLFKLTAVPFHMWSLDVYEGSYFGITAFFLIVPKISILAFLIKLLYVTFYDLFFIFQPVLLICSLFSIFVGAFGALQQKKIKRLLSYSSIGHVGFLLLGISCGTLNGLESVLYYLVVYTFTTIVLFSILLSIRNLSNNNLITYITDLKYLDKTNPLLAFLICCTMFSFGGIPPFAGFTIKFALIKATVESNLTFFAIISTLLSVISSFYYLRIVKIIYFDSTKLTIPFYNIIPKQNALLISIIVVFVLVDPTLFFIYDYIKYLVLLF